jgi:hypothetical protein
MLMLIQSLPNRTLHDSLRLMQRPSFSKMQSSPLFEHSSLVSSENQRYSIYLFRIYSSYAVRRHWEVRTRPLGMEHFWMLHLWWWNLGTEQSFGGFSEMNPIKIKLFWVRQYQFVNLNKFLIKIFQIQKIKFPSSLCPIPKCRHFSFNHGNIILLVILHYIQLDKFSLKVDGNGNS